LDLPKQIVKRFRFSQNFNVNCIILRYYCNQVVPLRVKYSGEEELVAYCWLQQMWALSKLQNYHILRVDFFRWFRYRFRLITKSWFSRIMLNLGAIFFFFFILDDNSRPSQKRITTNENLLELQTTVFFFKSQANLFVIKNFTHNVHCFFEFFRVRWIISYELKRKRQTENNNLHFLVSQLSTEKVEH